MGLPRLLFLLALVAVASLAPPSLSAQGRTTDVRAIAWRPTLPSDAASEAARELNQQVRLDTPATHWKAGLIIGALLGVSFGYGIGSWCGDSGLCSPLGTAVALGVAGATIGAFIGDGIPAE